MESYTREVVKDILPADFHQYVAGLDLSSATASVKGGAESVTGMESGPTPTPSADNHEPVTRTNKRRRRGSEASSQSQQDGHTPAGKKMARRTSGSNKTATTSRQRRVKEEAVASRPGSVAEAEDQKLLQAEQAPPPPELQEGTRRAELQGKFAKYLTKLSPDSMAAVSDSGRYSPTFNVCLRL